MTALRALLTTSLFGLGCAATPAPVAEAPACEPETTITVADPSPSAPTVVLADERELVTLRLFVVSPDHADPSTALPQAIAESNLCHDATCSLLLSPMLLGRDRSEMKLEVGTGRDDNLFAMQARPRLDDDHIALELQARLFADAEDPQHFEFEGSLVPDQITHIGTFHANTRDGHVVGAQVFAVAALATPAD